MKDNIFTKEVKGENVLLLILSIVAIILGILLFAGILTISSETTVIGGHSDIFTWIITIMGAIGLFIAVFKLTHGKKEDN